MQLHVHSARGICALESSSYNINTPVRCLLSGLTTGGVEEVFGTAPLVVAVGVLELAVVAFIVVASAVVVVVGASHCWVFYGERKSHGGRERDEREREREREKVCL